MDVAMVGLGHMGGNMARRPQAIAHSVPMPAISAALFTRFRSRQQDTFSGKVLAALRNEFGGHAVKEKE
jgi:6-phosphogluconate dehydrogenase